MLVTDDRAPVNVIKNVRCICVSHLGSDILQEGSALDGTAQQAGVRSGDISFNDIQRVDAVGKDKNELEKALSFVIVKKDCKSKNAIMVLYSSCLHFCFNFCEIPFFTRARMQENKLLIAKSVLTIVQLDSCVIILIQDINF